MKSTPRGQALIMNIRNFDKSPERNGSEIDRERIEKLFKKLNFSVTVTNKEIAEKHGRNLAQKEEFMGYVKLDNMKEDINEFAKKNHGDCCVVVIMSHGYQGPAIQNSTPQEPAPRSQTSPLGTQEPAPKSQAQDAKPHHEALRQLPFVVYSSDEKPLAVE
ncbi:unnamed protein product, partial [Darwinula stevensoni]